jgi:hypothetical protein
MKKLNLMLVLPALLAMQNVFAQTAAHLKLSDQPLPMMQRVHLLMVKRI